MSREPSEMETEAINLASLIGCGWRWVEPVPGARYIEMTMSLREAQTVATRLETRQLPAKASTRSGDPSTSREAAKSIGDLRESQRDVLFMFQNTGTFGGYTDEELIARYPGAVRGGFYLKKQSDQGIRSRRSELVRAGFVRDSGIKRKISTGRMSIVWELVRD